MEKVRKNLIDPERKKALRDVRRVVVKLGSSLLMDARGCLSMKALAGLARDVATLEKKAAVTIVSSGAIACGMSHLGFKARPGKMGELQACAAVGQPILMQMYQKAFGRVRLHVAQILLTRSDLEDAARFLNAKHTLSELLNRRQVPIINENDTVVVDEIRVGDNDNLAALTTRVVEADLLILLTDQDGFYTADPRLDRLAKKIHLVESLDPVTLEMASGTQGVATVGGMKTKLEAARKAADFGIPTVIASGRTPRILERLLAGEPFGTLFQPRQGRLASL